VVNSREDRAEITRGLRAGKHIGDSEEIGIEMEASGICDIGNNVGIVKSVCDYADERKRGEWTDEVKTLFQLFAAECAAEYTVRVIEKLPVSRETLGAVAPEALSVTLAPKV
jgi:hypothetical protein